MISHLFQPYHRIWSVLPCLIDKAKVSPEYEVTYPSSKNMKREGGRGTDGWSRHLKSTIFVVFLLYFITSFFVDLHINMSSFMPKLLERK